MFSQSNITFSSSSFNAEQGGQPFYSYQMDDKLFGTIAFQVSDIVARHAELNIALIMDNSSSMDDMCDSSGRKRMQYAKFTAEQLCRKAQENATCPIKVLLTTFDTTVVSVFGMQELTSDTVDEMASKISTIYPNGSTDICAMLNDIIKMSLIKSEFVAFVLTDGQATSGETNVRKLIERACKIPETVQLELIGYGADHDFKLLKGIQQMRPNTGYRFIAEFEKSSFACSEIIYKILNQIAKNVKISVTCGEIYNWKTNTWGSDLDIENLVTKAKKTYAVRSNDPTQFKATIRGIFIETNEPFEYIISDEPLPLDNLTKEWLRNKTMRTIYEAGQIDDTLSRKIQYDIKQKLTDLMVEIKKYMDDNGLREDKVLIMLCDDIFTCHETIGIRNGNMYIHARQTSQGTQSIYNVEPPKARRFDPSFDLLLSLPNTGRSVSMLVGHMKKTQQMKIHVKTLDGRTIELITDEDEEIKDVRIMISNEIKKRPDNIAISFNGNEVNYRGTIISNGISEGDILEILDEMPTQMEEDDEDECGDIQNCSMSSSRLKQMAPPQIRRAPVMQGYTMSSIEDSPYVELNTLAFMRETSLTTPTNSI
jgi:hypothetical protein